MLQEIKNIDNSPRALKNFGYTMGIVFLLIALYLFLVNIESFTIFAAVGIAFILLGLILPKTLRYFNIVWMTIAIVLGHFISGLILVILFYIVLTPTGLVMRILSKDLLNLKFKPGTKSYWAVREKQEDIKDAFEKQF